MTRVAGPLCHCISTESTSAMNHSMCAKCTVTHGRNLIFMPGKVVMRDGEVLARRRRGGDALPPAIVTAAAGDKTRIKVGGE